MTAVVIIAEGTAGAVGSGVWIGTLAPCTCDCPWVVHLWQLYGLSAIIFLFMAAALRQKKDR